MQLEWHQLELRYEGLRKRHPAQERQLLASGSDLYEVVLAHLATRELDQPDLRQDPPAESGHPDSPVHD